MVWGGLSWGFSIRSPSLVQTFRGRAKGKLSAVIRASLSAAIPQRQIKREA